MIESNKISKLIEKIAPLNNKYRECVYLENNGTEILELMWKVGKTLENFLKKEKIKPHNLYWQIYGEAPGLKKSYITRDFLSYCFRIKKYFHKLSDIKKTFPNLKKYSLFREAFPLIENQKYRLKGDEYNKLIKTLNSNNNFLEIKSYIIELKNKKICISNPRTQRLSELKNQVDNFVYVFNHVYKLIKENNVDDIKKFRDNFSNQLLLKLPQFIGALTQEGLVFPKLEQSNNLSEENWINFIDDLKKLYMANIQTRNRFRRLVSSRKLMELAEMLDVIISDQKLKNFRTKKNWA
jgi:hypothetical protein